MVLSPRVTDLRLPCRVRALKNQKGGLISWSITDCTVNMVKYLIRFTLLLFRFYIIDISLSGLGLKCTLNTKNVVARTSNILIES